MAADKHYYDVPLIRQGNSKCCWYACYQMLYAFNGEDRADVKRRLDKVKISTEQALMIDDWGRAAIALKLNGMRVSHLESFDNMVDVLDRWGPMWCAGDFLDGSGHVIVISGWNQSNKTLRFIDPYELWISGSTSDYGHSYWWKLIKQAEWACQQWK